MKKIEVKNLSKSVKEKNILEDINIIFEKGVVYKLIGRNGCGKTTLIRCILGIDRYNSGSIKIYSESDEFVVTQKKIFEHISVFFPDASLPKTLKVSECLELFRVVNEFNGDMKEIISFFGIKTLLDKRINVLSTGEKNIILLITTLLSNAEVLILDEPFIGLDYYMKKKIGRIS